MPPRHAFIPRPVRRTSTITFIITAALAAIFIAGTVVTALYGQEEEFRPIIFSTLAGPIALVVLLFAILQRKSENRRIANLEQEMREFQASVENNPVPDNVFVIRGPGNRLLYGEILAMPAAPVVIVEAAPTTETFAAEIETAATETATSTTSSAASAPAPSQSP